MFRDENIKKKCRVCNQYKDLICFYKDRTSKDNLQKNCKTCSKKRSDNYFKSRHGLIVKIYNNQKNSSKRRGHALPGCHEDTEN